VNNSFDHTISGLRIEKENVRVVLTIAGVTNQPLSPSQWRGMIRFHDATNPALTDVSSNGVSCASCHPDGREDGNTWKFAEGIRNTPSLVGRDLQNTAPYHWDGAFQQLSDLQPVVQLRMGGNGLSAQDWADIMEYLANEPGPDNPNVAANGALTPQQQEGQSLFQGEAGCISCHSGADYTDNGFHDVGTGFTTIPEDQLEMGASVSTTALPNTPSLRGLFATAPYLHDASAATIEARLQNNASGLHGNTAALSAEELAALAAYLRTL
jgi:cytochrome c peroxidase